MERATFGEQADLVSYTPHTLTKTEAKAATCTEKGNKEYWTCEHCGKYFLSDDTNPETATAVEQSETILPALNHKNAIIRDVSEPTETKPGYSGDCYCPDCDTVVEKGYTYWIEDNLTWKLYEDGTLNISGTGAMKDYNSTDLSPVYENENVKKVVIEDGVTSIGNSAFEDCTSLTIITIPDSVTSIGMAAFESCSSLTSIAIPDGVTSIGAYAFSWCEGLTSITIPDSVTSIEAYAFSECSSLTSITIPNSVTSIGKGAFGNCNDLTDIYYPDTKMKWKKISIGENAISPDVTIHFVEPATTIYGDVNLDGKVDILDSVFLNKYLATLVQFSDVQAANADCCQDDVLDEKDARALTQFVILLIDDLPISPTQE